MYVSFTRHTRVHRKVDLDYASTHHSEKSEPKIVNEFVDFGPLIHYFGQNSNIV